jgi:hypothetical protein
MGDRELFPRWPRRQPNARKFAWRANAAVPSGCGESSGPECRARLPRAAGFALFQYQIIKVGKGWRRQQM